MAVKSKQKPTKSKKYVPSRTEQQLLSVLLDPASRLKTVSEICQDAKISRDTYYEIFKRSNFCALYKKEALNVIRRAVAPMTHALIREATRGSAPHLKMGLEITDIYTEKQDINIRQTVNFSIDQPKLPEDK